MRESLAGLNEPSSDPFYPLACPQLLALSISGQNPLEWKLGVPNSRIKQMIRTRSKCDSEVSQLQRFCYAVMLVMSQRRMNSVVQGEFEGGLL